jgi:hypothetical protein
MLCPITGSLREDKAVLVVGAGEREYSSRP